MKLNWTNVYKTDANETEWRFGNYSVLCFTDASQYVFSVWEGVENELDSWNSIHLNRHGGFNCKKFNTISEGCQFVENFLLEYDLGLFLEMYRGSC